MSKESALIYYCAVCHKFVVHSEGPHWLDDGTWLFCPHCGGTTVVHLESIRPKTDDVEKPEEVQAPN